MYRGHRRPAPQIPAGSLGVFLAIFLFLTAGIAFVGWMNFKRERSDLDRARRQELEAVADLKADQIAGWRADQLHLARTLRGDLLANEAVADLLAGPAPAAASRLEAWLTSLLASKEYRDVLLFDAGGTIRAAVAADPQAGEHARTLVQEALAAGQAVVSDLHIKPPASAIHIDMAVPLFRDKDGPAIAALLFRLDPEVFLFPLIQSWPAPSASAETLLVRRDGDEILYLNDLRHRKGTALSLRLPADSPELPAAMAARREFGYRRGRDYRGVPVLAFIREVPETPWILIAKIDEAEVFRPLWVRARSIALVSLSLVLAAGTFLSYLWRGSEAKAVRRQAEADQRHRALLERYRHLAAEANDSIVLLDAQGRVREANERALRTFGYPREALTGMPVSELRAPGAPSSPEALMRRIEAEDGAVYESVYKRRDGTAFPVEVSGRTIEVEGERFFQLIVRDITERKARERRIADSLAFNRRLLEAAPIGILVFKASGPCVLANPAIARMVGATVDDLLKQDYRQLGSWKHSGLLATAEAVLASGSGRTFESRTTSSFGKEIEFSCRMVPFVYEGEPQILVLFTDLAEQRRAEEGFRESEDRYRAFFENSLDAVLLTSPDGAILEANPAACRIFGRSEEELRRSGRAGLIDPGDSRVAEAIAERDRTGRYRGELTFVRADGSRFPGEVSSARFQDKQGRPRTSMIIRDATERKKAEEELRRQRELMRRLAAHLQSVREEERAQMSREIHDELGQSLTGLKYDLAWLRKRTEEAGLEARIASMSELLDATIDWARRIAMRLRPGMLDDLGLIPALDWLARELEGRTGIAVAFNPGPGIEAVSIGRDEATVFFRICQESLTNIAKHAGAKRASVALRAEAGRLILEVRDDGRGLTEADLAKPSSFGIQGMRERAAALDGEVRIDGAQGRGTVVTVTVPLRR